MKTSFDAIVIGTGQSGPSLAYRLAEAGQKVAIVERGRFGGTCVNTGCIPTKTMVASARAAYVARRSQDFGVTIEGGISVDMKRVKARKDDVSGQSRTGVEKMLTNAPNITVYRDHARFVSDREVRVGNDTLTANQIFVNVGARAAVPSIDGLSKISYLTNSSILEIDFVPDHLIVVGGSYVGLEFGQMFRRFGSEVTVLERGPQLMGREDPDISDRIRDILTNEGINVQLNMEHIDLGNAGGAQVLIATGRLPNTDDLGLVNTSIKIDKHGFIEVDDELQTTAPGVWAIGDCNGKGAFTHTSYNDFEIVAGNLLDNETRRVSDRITAYNVYIDPPLGRVGMTEEEVRRSGRKALIGKREMTKVGRAVEKGETQGFMKVLVDEESKLILGAAILGTDGDEAIHCILDVMYAKAPYTVLQRAVHIHPTVSELIPTMLGNLQPLEDSGHHSLMATLIAPTTRQELLARISEARQETDQLFEILHPSALYDRPIPERHRIVFYIGHLEAFDWNLFRDHLGLKSFNLKFDHLFAFGIDPVDGGLPKDAPEDWPLITEVGHYRNEIRRQLDAALTQAPEDKALAQLFNISIEHRLMHAETLEYMFHQLPVAKKVKRGSDRPFSTHPVSSRMVHVPAGRATLGLQVDSDRFGWDNEFEEHVIDVQAFSIDRYKVTNGQFLDFVNSGGYQKTELWSPGDWEWAVGEGITHPIFWVPSGGGWSYRTMFEEIPLQMDWPVYVSHAEASAYARWANKQLPSEQQWHRAAYGAPGGLEREYPWGEQAPETARQHWNPGPGGASPELKSSFGVEDLLATGWEWTATEFAPFSGFRIMPAYPGYSANFFDGKHYVMKGGSTRTAACMLRRSFRNWFQPHYQYVYAGFRCVKDSDTK